VNNIHEKDWAEEDWGGHSGMASNPYEEDGPVPEGARTPGDGGVDFTADSEATSS
jgi:hypothetical protein